MTECARCGDCCDAIVYSGNWNRLQEWVDWWNAYCNWAMHNLLDGEDGGTDLKPLQARYLADAKFIVEHWRPHPDYVGDAMPRFRCDMFDPISRLCTAHDHRPPICHGYPWYNERPGEAFQRLGTGGRCSFWADVSLENRPGTKLRSLPLYRGPTE